MSIFGSLESSANTLDVLQRALDVSQNNVSNASTPGYAPQSLSLESQAFEPAQGLVGGVSAGELQSARDQYADAEVRRQMESLGTFEQQVPTLTAIETALNMSGTSGIPGAMTALWQSFSAWSVDPNSATARQSVLDAATSMAQSFQRTATAVSQAGSDAEQHIQGVVQQINDLGAKLQDLNTKMQGAAEPDPGLDAQMQSTLEQLSELADFTALRQPDGTVTVLLGGQTPLVIGKTEYQLQAAAQNAASPPPTNANAPAQIRIISAQGQDITDQISQGQLGGLLQVRNRIVPGLIGDAWQTGDLNRMAEGLAGRVNELLTSGNISDGPPPQPGINLFSYDTSNPTNVARSLSVNPSITPDQLAAIDPGPPYSSNGIALRLANLSAPTSSADQIDGQSYLDFFGNTAAALGRKLSDAQDGQDTQTQAVAQAKSLRDQISGVSLDEEAMHVLEFQRSYEAASKLVSVLNDLTQTIINLIH